MLLNILSISMLSLAVISSILALCGGFIVLRAMVNWKKSPTASAEHNQLEKMSSRLFLFASIVLALRLCTYPLFYGALQSFVKDIDGAMCIYGVTQVLPNLCGFLEIIKPIVFFFIGGWLILHLSAKQCKTEAFVLKKLTFLLGITAAILIDSLGDLIFFLSMSSDTIVTCCTLKLDSTHRISMVICRYLFGQNDKELLLYVYYISNLPLIGVAGYITWGKKLEAKIAGRKKNLGLVFISALINFFLTGLTLFEIIAPNLMNLPYHHCPYCLLRYVPDSLFIIGFFILATFGFGWALGLELATTDKVTSGNLSRYLDRIYRFSFLGLSLSLAMVTFYLLRGGQ
jgi:hypothetical protein